MGQSIVKIKSEFYTSLKNESTQVVGDGLYVFDYIQSYAGINGLRFGNDKSGIIEGACSGANDYTAAKTTRYEMSLNKWATLMNWALDNYTTIEAAKIVLTMGFKLGQLKESAVSTIIDTTPGALKAVSFGAQFGPNYSLTSKDSLYNRNLAASALNTFEFNVGASLNGKTIGGTLYNASDLAIHTSNTAVVTNGILKLSITTSSFTSGYFVLDSGVMFAAADYSSALNSDIRLNDFFNIGLHGAYMIGV